MIEIAAGHYFHRGRMRGKIEYRLRKEMILRGRDNFQMLFDRGKGFRSGNVVLKYRIAAEESPSRVVTAFIVPKKHGRAVDRNRARRLMREAWRLAYPELVGKLPGEIVLHLALIWAGAPARVKPPEFRRVESDLLKGIEKMLAKLPGLQVDASSNETQHEGKPRS